MTDAVVVGAGQNGLVAANVLADAGWSVVVLEAEPEPGGAVRSAELFGPGVVSDRFSAFYPLAYVSPALAPLELERHGLRWCRAPEVVANPLPDGRCATLSPDLDRTADSLDRFAGGDGDRWRELHQRWDDLGDLLLEAFLTPFPPVGAAARLAARLGPDRLAEFARFALLPVRRLAAERFAGEGGALLLSGNAMHSGLLPEAVLSGFYGWMLSCIGQGVGFPVPEGGSGNLVAALVRRLEGRGGTVHCGVRVTGIEVRGGRAVGVTTADGSSVSASKAVLADVAAPALYLELVPREALPPRVLDQLQRFQFDPGTCKVDWYLDGGIPWPAGEARRAGTVHVADGLDHYTEVASQLARGLIPERPHLVLGQMTTADPSRSPAGTETAWAYAHVPQLVKGDVGPDGLTGRWDEREGEIFADRIEAVVERFAPGFRSRIRARVVQTPPMLQAADANLVGGAINAGTAELYQQLVFRPLPGLARPRTPVDRLYLASASAHPGGGVHGAPGANAAAAALGAERRRRVATAMGVAAAGGAAARGFRSIRRG